MTEPAAPTTLTEALCQVMGDLPGIAKVPHPSQNGKGLTYAYRGIEEITREVQGLFAKYGIVIIPQVQRRQVEDIEVNGNPWSDTYLEVRWLVCGHGEQIEARTFGVGRDNSDKGTNKAMTQAFKYLLLDMLCISDPADDNDGVNIEATNKPAARYPASSTAKPASEKQINMLKAIGKGLGLSPEALHKIVDDAIDRTTKGWEDLTSADVSVIKTELEKRQESAAAEMVGAAFGASEEPL